MRDAINKNVTYADVMKTVNMAFSGGWTAVKLYFMIGLPTETLDDVAGIAQLGQQVVDEFYRNPDRPKGKGVQVSISASSFVPKPFTPFQWEPQDTMEQLEEKQKHLYASVTTKKIRISTHLTPTSFLEGVFARGDRRLSKVLELAWKKDVNLTVGTIILTLKNGWKLLMRQGLTQASMQIAAVILTRFSRGIILITA